MLISNATWNRIREQFSEEEKEALRDVVTARTICPDGFVIDETKLEAGLLEKLRRYKMIVGNKTL